jgi:hypothetical protein
LEGLGEELGGGREGGLYLFWSDGQVGEVDEAGGLEAVEDCFRGLDTLGGRAVQELGDVDELVECLLVCGN